MSTSSTSYEILINGIVHISFSCKDEAKFYYSYLEGTTKDEVLFQEVIRTTISETVIP